MGSIKPGDTTVLIDKQEVPAKAWNVTVGSFGSIGTVSITTTCLMLESANLNLVGLVDTSKVIPIDVFVDIGGERRQIFGGFYDSNDGDWPEEQITIQGRDWSGSMMDKSSCLAGDTRTVQAIITSLCQIHGLTPVFRGNANRSVDPGVELNGDKILTMTPQTHWSIVQKLAQYLSFEVSVTPQRQLIFGPPELDPPTRVFHYMAPDGSKPDWIKLLKLHTKNNNRRSRTFRVRVTSWDPQRIQKAVGETVVIGEETAGANPGQSIANGIYGGAAGQGVSSVLGKALNDKPLYRFNYPGLSPEQAQQMAKSIATDIAKREFVVSGTLSGFPDLMPHDRMTIQDDLRGNLRPYCGRGYSIVGVEHSYQLPPPGSQGEGYLTKFSAVAIPPGISDDVSAAFANWTSP